MFKAYKHEVQMFKAQIDDNWVEVTSILSQGKGWEQSLKIICQDWQLQVLDLNFAQNWTSTTSGT